MISESVRQLNVRAWKIRFVTKLLQYTEERERERVFTYSISRYIDCCYSQNFRQLKIIERNNDECWLIQVEPMPVEVWQFLKVNKILFSIDVIHFINKNVNTHSIIFTLVSTMQQKEAFNPLIALNVHRFDVLMKKC